VTFATIVCTYMLQSLLYMYIYVMRCLPVALYVATVYVECASLKRKCESESPPTERQRG